MPTHPAADLKRAAEAFRRRDYAVAHDIYETLVSDGHVDSLVMLGWLRFNGLGYPKDEAAAVDCFRRAARMGSAAGEFYYARYLTRIGQVDEAFRLYKSAAASGYLPALFSAGATLAQRSERKDMREAYSYLLSAARRGHMYALREVAVLDLRGHRGFEWRLLGLFEFAVAFAGALLLTLLDPESDRLRA